MSRLFSLHSIKQITILITIKKSEFSSPFVYILMLIYLEKKAKSYPQTQKILSKFPNAQILEIDHYKNIFDKNIWDQNLTPAFIIAKQEHIPLLPVPENYGRTGKSFFFKTSLNCVYDCEYCYLKGNFKTKYSVLFVNYEEIKSAISEKINLLRETEKYQWPISFYASNYSDIQGVDSLTDFNQTFIPFFEQFENVLMETRTKSPNISSILSCNNGIPPKNTEFSFSLNPDSIIKKYEKGTATLEARISAIKALTEKGYRVWLRFLPLLPVENYDFFYRELLKKLKSELNFDLISSIFIASLIYNPWDFKIMQKKNPNSDLRPLISPQENWLIKIPTSTREHFLKIFREELPDQEILFDYV